MAKTKAVSKKQLDNLLGVEHFSKINKESGMMTDPVQPVGMTINLDQIESYDRNPRRAENMSYEELKKDLREDGSERVTITITRRPGGKKYMPDMGGNTRLTILKELYRETGDEKYFWLRVTFIPYKDEADVLIHHLIENDVRSDYIFIDRALGIREAYIQLCVDDDKEYAQRGFIDQLKKRGYSGVSRTSLITFNYAVDHLYTQIPNALDGGMGSPKVTRLKRIESKYTDYWIAHQQDENEFKTHWQQILAQNDSWDSFCPDMVERDLLNLVTGRIQTILSDYPALITTDTIKLEVDQFQKDPGLVSTLSTEDNYGWPVADEVRDTVSAIEIASPGPSDQSLGHIHSANRLQQVDTRAEPQVVSDRPSGDTDGYLKTVRTGPIEEAKLSNLRAKSYETAKSVSESFGFQDVLCPFDSGYGYYCEVPDSVFHQTEELKAYFWWQLFLVASIHNYSNYELLPKTSNYRMLAIDIYERNPALESDDVVRDVLGQIESNIETFVPKSSPFVNTPLLFESDHVDESDFESYLMLLQLRRQMRDSFSLEDLWGA